MAESTPVDRAIPLQDDAATAAFGAALARALDGQGCLAALITLSGALGAGKTTLARGMLRALGHTGSVPSPTYALLEPYQCGPRTLNHLDLYRLAGAEELEFIGWRDLGDTVRLVEWPERVAGLVDQADLALRLEFAGSGRRVHCRAGTPAGARLLAAIEFDND